MQQRVIGDTPVSAVGLGAMYLSIRDRPDAEKGRLTIEAAIDAGIRFIDTADVYCLDDDDLGHSERLIAEVLRERPEKVLVGTKGGLRRPGGAWTRDARPEQLTLACEASLRALDVETIDLYQLHAPDPKVPFADSVGALAKLKDQGKIRMVGLSNVSVAEIEAARQIVPIVSVQNRYSPSHRAPERDGVLEYCEKNNIAFLPYSPFGGATGARTLGAQGNLSAEARRRGMSPHRLVIAWMLAKSPVVIPLVGARRMESIEDSARAAALSLGPEDMTAIEQSF